MLNKIIKNHNPLHSLGSYKNPLTNRRSINNQKLFAKLEAAVAVNDMRSDMIKTFLRPRVSDKKPHRKDDKITPKYPIAPKTPLSLD